MPHILALDQGTTSSRAIVFDDAGSVKGMAQAEFPQAFPRPGWVEHDPELIWLSQLDTARQAIINAGLEASDIAAIGIANQRETAVAWDRGTGRPVHPAIVWQDRRTEDTCEELRSAGASPRVKQRTGLELDPYFSAAKVAWILNHVGSSNGLAFGTIDSFLIWRLTGGLHVTDRTNASRTSLMHLESGQWDAEMADLFRVPMAMLPEIRPSVGDFGLTKPEWFGRAIPISGVAGDQQAALAGQAAFRPGLVKNTYGTGCFMLMQAGDVRPRSKARLLETTAAVPEGGFALEGSVFVAGAAVQWLRDGLGLIADSTETQALAESVPDTGGVFLVPAFAGLGAPHWDAEARGTLAGLTRGTTKAHVVRATLESMAYQTCDLLRAMEEDCGVPIRELRVDGGASGNDFLMQFQADVAGVPVVRPSLTETTAFGAAVLAGLGSGFWKGTDDIESLWKAERTFEPAMDTGRRGELLQGWTRAVRQTRTR